MVLPPPPPSGSGPPRYPSKGLLPLPVMPQTSVPAQAQLLKTVAATTSACSLSLTSPRGISNLTNNKDPESLKSRVFVGNLNTFIITKEFVESVFEKYGAMEAVSMHKGYAFIQYTCEQDARDAVKGEVQKVYAGQAIDVNIVCEPKHDRMSRKRPNTVMADQRIPTLVTPVDATRVMTPSGCPMLKRPTTASKREPASVSQQNGTPQAEGVAAVQSLLVCATCDAKFSTTWDLIVHCQILHQMAIIGGEEPALNNASNISSNGPPPPLSDVNDSLVADPHARDPVVDSTSWDSNTPDGLLEPDLDNVAYKNHSGQSGSANVDSSDKRRSESRRDRDSYMYDRNRDRHKCDRSNRDRSSRDSLSLDRHGNERRYTYDKSRNRPSSKDLFDSGRMTDRESSSTDRTSRDNYAGSIDDFQDAQSAEMELRDDNVILEHGQPETMDLGCRDQDLPLPDYEHSSCHNRNASSRDREYRYGNSRGRNRDSRDSKQEHEDFNPGDSSTNGNKHSSRNSYSNDKNSYPRDRTSYPRNRNSHPRNRNSHPRNGNSYSRDRNSHSKAYRDNSSSTDDASERLDGMRIGADGSRDTRVGYREPRNRAGNRGGNRGWHRQRDRDRGNVHARNYTC